MRLPRPHCPLLVLLLAALLLAGPPARAADPQPYTVHIDKTGNGALDSALNATSQLVSLRKTAPVGPFALIDRAQQDIGRLQTALGSFGYYRAQIVVSIDSHPLDDPALPQLLQAMSAKQEARVEVAINRGPLFHLRGVDIQGAVSQAALAAFGLKSGAPAVAADVLAARQRLLTALEDEGHAFATVSDPVAYETPALAVLDVSFKVNAGPIYVLGPVRFEGLTHVHEAFVRAQLKLRPGQPYSPTAIETARTTLLGMGVFDSVTVRLPPQNQASGDVLPVTFLVVESKKHAVGLNGEYSSDLGVIAEATWTDRNLLGNAEQLTLHSSVFGLGTSSTGVGYDVGGQFSKPDFLATRQSLQLTADALKQYLLAYTQVQGTVGASLSRQLSGRWNVSLGVNLAAEQIKQNEMVDVSEALVDPAYVDNGAQPPTAVGVPTTVQVGGCSQAYNQAVLGAMEAYDRQYNQVLPKYAHEPPPPTWCHYTLLGVPISARYDSTGLTNPLSDPTHGLRLSLSLQPTESLSSSLSSRHSNFLIMQANLSAYFDFANFGWSQPGHSVLALRAIAGEANGAAQFSLPPDQRFYAGGSATVRGYAYQSISPWFGPPDRAGQYPEGGTGLAAGTVELREHVWGNFGLALFLDAGEVTTRPPLLNASGSFGTNYAYGLGYGLGPRYYTPIGPIRLDVAFPLKHKALLNESAFQVYIGLGQAF
jgi:translocation and assembly module TamA